MNSHQFFQIAQTNSTKEHYLIWFQVESWHLDSTDPELAFHKYQMQWGPNCLDFLLTLKSATPLFVLESIPKSNVGGNMTLFLEKMNILRY